MIHFAFSVAMQKVAENDVMNVVLFCFVWEAGGWGACFPDEMQCVNGNCHHYLLNNWKRCMLALAELEGKIGLQTKALLI